MSADVANEEGDILDLADELADNHTPEAENAQSGDFANGGGCRGQTARDLRKAITLA